MKRRKEVHKKIYNFTAIFEQAKEGGFIVHVPALPGCHTQGETFEEATAMAKDAIEAYIATLKDLRERIPEESGNIIVSTIPTVVTS